MRAVSSTCLKDTYSRMDNHELLRLASQWKTLTERAQEALATELEKRKLKNEFEAERRIALEKPMPSSGSPSVTERITFTLFAVSLPCAFLLPHAGLVASLWPIWMIVWLVLHANRIQKNRAA